jgi:hypothetical protein
MPTGQQLAKTPSRRESGASNDPAHGGVSKQTDKSKLDKLSNRSGRIGDKDSWNPYSPDQTRETAPHPTFLGGSSLEHRSLLASPLSPYVSRTQPPTTPRNTKFHDEQLYSEHRQSRHDEEEEMDFQEQFDPLPYVQTKSEKEARAERRDMYEEKHERFMCPDRVN